MIIKLGYDNKPTEIRITPTEGHDRMTQVWINQKGLPKVRESLAYATIDELLNLREEINYALRQIV